MRQRRRNQSINQYIFSTINVRLSLYFLHCPHLYCKLLFKTFTNKKKIVGIYLKCWFAIKVKDYFFYRKRNYFVLLKKSINPFDVKIKKNINLSVSKNWNLHNFMIFLIGKNSFYERSKRRFSFISKILWVKLILFFNHK